MVGLRRAAGVLVALLVLGPACNSRLLRPPATIFVDGGESTITVTFGRDEEFRFPATMLSFFPSTVPLHPGDGVRFDIRYSGEPHTVALGRLVDAAVEAADALGPTATRADIENLPEMQRIPDVLPRAVGEGGAEVNRSAAERCFLDDGDPPNSPTGGAEPCPERIPPDFDGTQAFYSSGFLPEGEGFRMNLSGDTAPGTYRFMCLVHRTDMTGALEVRDPSVDRPAVAQVKVEGREEERVVQAAVSTAARNAARPPEGVRFAGAGPERETRGYVTAFIPEQTSARVGEPVEWRMYGTHTIAFNPERRAREGILVQESGGEVRINRELWDPVESAPPPPEAVQFPPHPEEVRFDGGTWSGEGTWSSGVLRSRPPGIVSYTMRFEQPGNYTYFCLVHDRMRGRIEVTE